MQRIAFFAALIAITALAAFRPMPKDESTWSDEGCFNGGAAYDYEMIHRIVIWNADTQTGSYLEEIPCGSNNWFERSNIHIAPPSSGGNPGVFTSSGTVEFMAAPDVAGVITPGTGPDHRGFVADPTSGKLVVSAPVVASVLQSLH
ncbi:MAG: hypothetical protein JST22_12790 [Bacteroidetes bacterium]|nr:hypothetical protein [Bacteroidota bacterium]